MKRFILKLLGKLSLIEYCPIHEIYKKPQGYYDERSYCPKCSDKAVRNGERGH